MSVASAGDRMPRLENIYDRTRERHKAQIGRPRDRVTTPALILDLDVARRNIAAMAAKFAGLPASLRPHIKVHKSPSLARLEVAAGAVGVTCATVWEAETMALGGIGDILIANQVVHPDKVEALATLARDHRITVAVDDPRNLDQLDRALQKAGAGLEVLIELDVGMGRSGVRTNEQALDLARHLESTPRLGLRGLQGYEGHCMGEPDRQVRIDKTLRANAQMVAAADYLIASGHEVGLISGGGTGTYYITGANPRIGEVQAGSYSLMDSFHASLVPGEFEVALSVLATVISEQGSTVVLDAGRKSVGIDYVLPPLLGPSRGAVRAYSEEHCLVDFDGPADLHLGQSVEIMAGYAPTTVNLHDVFHVVEDGVVTDIWPVAPRGPGQAV